jgi:hypothetical protein
LRVLPASEEPASCDIGKRCIRGRDEEFVTYLLSSILGVHPLGIILVLPERAGAAVRTVVKATVDTLCRVGAGVTCRGCLPGRFCLGLHFAAHTKDVMMLRLMGSSTYSTQLGFKGAHHGMVAIPPTPRADGDTDLLLCRKDGEGFVTKHKAPALEAAEALTITGVVDIKEHCTGV